MNWTVGWVLWLVMFLAIEGAALVNRDRGDTLSEHVWKWFGLRGKPSGYRWRRFAFLAFWAWLTVHFFTGGWV